MIKAIINDTLKYRAIAIPVTVQTIIFNLFFYADAFILGFIGVSSVAIASAGAQFLWAFEAMVAAFSYVCGVYIGREVDTQRKHNILIASLILTLLLAISAFCLVLFSVDLITLFLTKNVELHSALSDFIIIGTISLSIGALATVIEAALNNRGLQSSVSFCFGFELAIKVSLSLLLVFYFSMDTRGIAFSLLLSKIFKLIYLSIIYITRIEFKTRYFFCLDLIKKIIFETTPLALSVLAWNVLTLLISSYFGSLSVEEYTVYLLFSNALFVFLIPIESITKSLVILISKKISNQGSCTKLGKRVLSKVMVLSLFIGLASSSFGSFYIYHLGTVQPELSSDVLSTIKGCWIMFFAMILFKTVSDGLCEGLLRPILMNTFVLKVETVLSFLLTLFLVFTTPHLFYGLATLITFDTIRVAIFWRKLNVSM